ncbi:MAG: amidohydrolase family protein [Planctomycetes bacterium]|nr:amidohydrolase family protein [Planctomycetota bacterium]
MMCTIIDGYCHCGLRKYRPIEDLRLFMDELGICRSVLVQHMGQYDNSYIEGVVAAEPQRFAGVMLVDVDSPDACSRLGFWTEGGVFRGVRLIASTIYEHPGVWKRAAGLGLNIVIYDEAGLVPHLDPLRKFASEHPHCRLVLSHLGVLNVKEAPHYDSHRRLLELADLGNVYVQISGFSMFAEYPYTALVDVVRRLIEAFGPGRSFYGTNFPAVSDDEAAYSKDLELICTGKLGVPPDALDDILNGTAMRLWFHIAPKQ